MDLLESLDPEDARRLVDPALELMVEVVRRFDGRVVQSTGDGIFALFGAPIAHGDDPQRAIYAALELQDRIRRYSDSLRESGRVPLHVRVGVNTGEVVVRSVRTDETRVEYTPIGHPTSLAARLQSLATPGAVVVGDQTRKLAEGFFQFRALDPHKIKGVSQPVIAYEVIDVGPLRTRLEAAARRGLAKFVGRDAELSEMKRAFARAQAGQGQIVGVVGDAGIGKSRLFHEFKATSHDGFKLLETSGIAHAKDWVYLPLVGLLKKYLDLQPADDGETRRNKIKSRLSSLDPGLLDTVPYLNALLGAPEADDPIAGMDRQLRKQRTLDAIKRLLVRESLEQPLIVIFEDLHWFDNESLEFLTLLADSLGNLKILMLVNHRPEFTHTSGGKSYYRQLRLERARELCRLVGDSSQLVPALFGLWVFHNFGGKLKAAQELGEELLSIAESRQDPAAILMAHTSLGITMTFSGELRRAFEHCTQGVAVFSPEQRLPAFSCAGPLFMPHLAGAGPRAYRARRTCTQGQRRSGCVRA